MLYVKIYDSTCWMKVTKIATLSISYVYLCFTRNNKRPELNTGLYCSRETRWPDLLQCIDWS